MLLLFEAFKELSICDEFPVIITIDGTAGSGKSTVARKIANKLGLIHLNSGALFRAVTYLAMKNNLSLDDEVAITKFAQSLEFKFVLRAGLGSAPTVPAETIFLVNGKDISAEISAEEVGRLVSKKVSLNPSLRQVLLEVQRKVAQQNSVIVEGRDSGTVVFPDADLKLFLDASLEVRTKRRLAEFQGVTNLSFEELQKQIEKRDLQDSSRSIAPLTKTSDAQLIDTSGLNPDQVVEQILQMLRAKDLIK